MAESAVIEGNIIISGAGPSGLGVALMLARQGRGRHIYVIEKSEVIGDFDPSKSFPYGFSVRGGVPFAKEMGLWDELHAEAVRTQVKQSYWLTSHPDGKLEKVEVKRSGDAAPEKEPAPYFLLHRHSLVHIIADKLRDSYSSQVTVLSGCTVSDVQRITSGTKQGSGEEGKLFAVEVQGNKQEGQEDASMLITDVELLVGADGFGSQTRKMLEHWEQEDEVPQKQKRFSVTSIRSASARMRFKSFRCIPNFPLTRDPNGMRADLDHRVRFKGRHKDNHRRMFMSKFPSNSEWIVGTSARPSNKLFTCRTGEEMWDHLQDCFPQIAIEQLITREECNVFAEQEGAIFPTIQYTKGMQYTKGATVVLVGDSVRSHPPDPGLGVNKALEDVLLLKIALENHPTNLAEALKAYEESNLENSIALAKLVRFFNPYQYSQVRYAQDLFQLNLKLRSKLHSWFPGTFNPQVVMMLRKEPYNTDYSSFLQRAHQTTFRMGVAGSLILLLFAYLVKLVRRMIGSALQPKV